jgi:hypothetical protein
MPDFLDQGVGLGRIMNKNLAVSRWMKSEMV